MGEVSLALTGEKMLQESPGEMELSQRWIRAAQAGDQMAFRELMELHQRQVLRSAFRLLGDWELAREAAQEAFLRLYKFLPRIDAEKPLAAWLHRVTVNVCRDLYNRCQPALWVSIEAIKEEGEWDPPSQEMDAQQLYLRREQQRLIAQALQALPPREREALVLRDIEGLSTSEVAEILGLRKSTVRVQISSARLKIRGYLDQKSGGK